MRRRQSGNLSYWRLCVGLAAAIALVPTMRINAQDLAATEEVLEDIDLLSLEVPVVVTGATRRAQKIEDLPYAVTVLTEEDIRSSGADRIADLFRLVPGVDVGSVLYGWNVVSPRGFYSMTSDQGLVLVDGRRIYEPVLGGTDWSCWPFLLEDIERIEVVRGPAAVSWGSGATDGLINIVTKDPVDQLGLTVRGRGGSRGTNQEYLGYGFTEGKLRMRVSGSHQGTDGYLDGGLWSVQDDSKIGHLSLYGIYDVDANDTIIFSGGSSIVDGLYSPNPIVLMGRTNPNCQSNYLMTRWQHQVAEDNCFELTGFFNDFFQDTGMPMIQYRYQQFGLEFTHSFKPADHHTLTWGVDTHADITDAGDAYPQFLRKDFVGTGNIGVYVQDEWQFAPKWSLDLGGRIDYEFYGGWEPSARAAISYKPTDKSMIYGAVSRAFLMPPAAGRFVDFPMMLCLGRTVALPDLDTTTLMAYEIGYRQTFFDKLKTSLTLYWHEYNDIFGSTTDFAKENQPLVDSRYHNLGGSSIYGIELEAEYPITDKLLLLGNYTYQEIDWRGSTPFVGAMDAPTPPEHKFMVGARYSPHDDWHFSGHFYYTDSTFASNPNIPIAPQRIDSYFRLDLRAEHEFWNDRGWIAVGVSNLLDPAHPEATSIFTTQAQVPRMVYGEIRINFN